MFFDDSKPRSTAYIGTINITASTEADSYFINLTRKLVKEANQFYTDSGGRRRLYVKLRGRGPRLGNKKYNQDLPLEFAKTADVYIYNRYDR